MSNENKVGVAPAVILAIVPLFAMLGAVLMVPLIATMIEHFKDVPHAGYLVLQCLTAPALFLAVLSPVAGWLCDRHGARPVLFVSYAIYGVFGVAPVFLQSLHAILASRLLVGVAEAGLVTASTALLAAYFSGSQRSKWFSYQSILLPMIGAGVVLSSGSLASLNWRLSFLVYGSSLIMLALAYWLLPRNAVQARSLPATPATQRRNPFSLPGKIIALIAGIAIPGSIAFYVGPLHLSELMTAIGHPDQRVISWVMAVAMLVGPPLILLVRLFPKVTAGQWLALGMLVMGAGLWLMTRATSLPAMWLGFVCQQAGGAVMFSTGVTYVVGLARPEERGLYSGAWGFIYMLAQFFTPMLTELANSFTGSTARTITLFGVIAAACSLWLIAARSLRVPPQSVVAGH